MPAYFGLGSNTSVESITIEWPSGKVQVVDGPIASNQLIQIEETPGGKRYSEVEAIGIEGSKPSHDH